MTIRTHPDVGFRLERLEVHGRLENGKASVPLSDEEVTIEHTPPSPSSWARVAVATMLCLYTAIVLGLAAWQLRRRDA